MPESNRPQFQPNFRTDPSRALERQNREIQAAQEERLDSGELWDAVKQSEWVAPRLSENARFSTGLFSGNRGEPAISSDRLARELGNQYNQQEYDFIGKATSEEDYQARLDKVATDRELAQKISGEGWRGTGYSMAAGLVDPALLPLYLVTGGGAALGRASLLTRTAASGALGAAEGAAIEAILATGDTQRDWRDIVLGGVTGGVMTGSITLGTSGYKRLRHGSEPQPDLDRLRNNPELAEEARNADADLSAMSRDYRAERAASDLEEGLSFEYIQGIEPRQALMDELLPLAETRLSRGDRAPLLQEQASLQNRIQQLQRTRDELEPVGTGGTNRQRVEAARLRHERIAEIEARMQPVSARLKEIEDTLEADLPAREAWADISRLQQGQVPNRFRDRYNELRRNQTSPMNQMESQRTREELARRRAEQERADAEMRADEVRRPEGAARGPDTQSVGAARVEGATDPQDAYTEAGTLQIEEHKFRATQMAERMPKRDWIRKLAGGGNRRLSSTYSDLSQSESNLIRGLSHTLLSDPQAATRGHIAAAHRVVRNNRILQAVEGGREAVARDAWAAEQGISGFRMQMMEGEYAMDFDNAVVLQIKGIDQGSQAIRDAAEARKDLLSAALKMRKDAGEGGWENLTDKPDYWSFLPSYHKMQAAVAKYDADEVIELLTGSYMNGRFRLNETSARMVARATYARTMQQGLDSSQTAKYALSKADIGALRADMAEAGVGTRQIDAFLEETERTAEATGVSDRAKLSLGADMTYTSPSGLRMVDVLDTSIQVTNRYSLEASAGAALARSGFKSRTELEAVIADSEKTARNIILEGRDGMSAEDLKAAERRAAQVGRESKKLMDSIKLMYGESLDTDLGGAIKVSRGARKATNIVALQWNGFASMGEASNQLVNMGVGTTLRNTRFRDFASFGKIRESDDLKGFGDNLVGAYGQYGASIKDNNYSMQTMDEYNQGRMERIYNNGAGWVSNKTQLMSGFRSVQHGLENVLMRSMQDRFVRIADGKIRPKQRDFDEMERAGLRRDQIDEVMQSIKNNPEYATVNGKQVRIFTGKNLDPALKEDVGTAMTVMMSRNMQSNFVGDTPVWMDKELGKMMTVFRSFSILSVEKQLAAGLRGDTIGMFLKTMFGVAIGAGAYSSRAWIRAQNSEDPEEKFESYMQGPTMATGVVNMTPHLGLIGMGMELGYASGMIQHDSEDAGMIASRSGSRPLTAEGAIPTVGVAFDAINAGRDIIGGTLYGDSDRAWKGVKDAYGMAPIVNTAAIGTAMALANRAVD